MKRLIAFLMILLYGSNTSPITVGLTLLSNPQTGQKMTLISDEHYECYNEPQNPILRDHIKEQVIELKNLAKFLSLQPNSSIWISECSCPGEKNPEQTTLFTISNLFYGINDELLLKCLGEYEEWLEEGYLPTISYDVEINQDKIGNLSYWSFETRDSTEMVIADLALSKSLKELSEYQEKHSYWSHKLTIPLYEDYLTQNYKKLRSKLQESSLSFSLKTEVIDELDMLYTEMIKLMHANKNIIHMFDLIKFYVDNQRYDLLQHFVTFNLQRDFELYLLLRVSKLKEKYIVVQCGGAHIQWLKDKLIKDGWKVDSDQMHSFLKDNTALINKAQHAGFKETLTLFEQHHLEQLKRVPIHVDRSVRQYFT